MGVPSFYRWLVDAYPKIVVNAKEGGEDCSEPNPNGMEFDNLYLDMNGIIHPCFHPEDQLSPPTKYDDVFEAIFEYIDRIFRIVRPRKLLYVAIDGVAPRAKMNQQRSRRFRAAKDAELAETEEERLRQEFVRAGKKVHPREESEVSDPTVITPGTIFMQKLSVTLEYYIHSRLNSDPGWSQIKVILSDSNVPGEGEHKIMSFIRLQRNLAGYDPNTRHCLYGLDADLIMLALVSHEVHFSILREDVLKQQPIFEVFSREKIACRKTPYQFLNIWTLREYLEIDMRAPDPPVELNIERMVDDFVFMCFLAGNDFLPHIPSIEIHEGAIDLLITVYKNIFKKLGGYLVDTKRIKENKVAYIKLKRVEQFIFEVGSYENKIFAKRYQLRQNNIRRLLREGHKESNEEDNFDNMCDNLSYDFSKQCSTSASASEADDVDKNTADLKQKLKERLRDKMDLFKNGVFDNDKVKLGVPGWKCRYYKEKLLVENPAEVEETRKSMVKSYIEGLCWVLQYYFAGVCSWVWYYPFYYGPFASDFMGMSGFDIKFKLGFPLKPFDQLMAVVPPRSFSALPKPYRHLMSSEDSVIRTFYPTTFTEDMDGKRFAWQGIVKLPFIDEELLLSATKMKEKELEADDAARNIVHNEKILMMKSNSLGSQVSSIYMPSENLHERMEKKHLIDPSGGNMNGYLSLCVDHPDIDATKDHPVYAIFTNPDYHVHKPELLHNVIQPEKTITEADILERRLWHEKEGPHPLSNIRQQRFLPKEANASEEASLQSTQEMHTGAGAGWGSRGRGKETGGPYYASSGHMSSGTDHARGGSRGRGDFETGYSGLGNYAFNANQGGPGNAHTPNVTYGGYSGRGNYAAANQGGPGNAHTPNVNFGAYSGRGNYAAANQGGPGNAHTPNVNFEAYSGRGNYAVNANQGGPGAHSPNVTYGAYSGRGNYAVNANQGGSGNAYNPNVTYDGYNVRADNFAQRRSRTVDGRSGNWQWRSMTMAENSGRGHATSTSVSSYKGRSHGVNTMTRNATPNSDSNRFSSIRDQSDE